MRGGGTGPLKPRQQVLVFDRIHCANSSRFHWDLEDKKTGPANCELVPSLLVPLEEGVFILVARRNIQPTGLLTENL